MKRLTVFVAAVLAAAAVITSTASAVKPTREPGNFADRTFPGICAIDVARQVLVDRSIVTTYSDGTVKITGTFKQRLINLETGRFIDVNSSGPVIIEPPRADGSYTERDFGRQFERPPGQLLLTTGQVVLEFDADDNLISYRQVGGTTQDVCTLLA
jgi:hypothetical protein